MADIYPDPPLEEVLYMLNHVFLPPKLPQADDSKLEHDIALCDLTYRASLEFRDVLPEEQRQEWSSVINMLERLLDTTVRLDQGALQRDILGLDEGGTLVLRIRAQNAAVIMRRRKAAMIFESFEIQPLPEVVMETEGKLVCSFPGPAVELPLEVALDPSFVENLASFLVQMDVDNLPGAQPITVKADSEVIESRSTPHPRYITQLLSMILLGMGNEAKVERITKRIADEVCWKDAQDPWRRSPLWLVIRVAVQTTAASRNIYKLFMIFLQMKLLRLFLHCELRSELLYVTRVKTSRRVYKLGNAASPVLQLMKDLSEKIQICLEGRWSQAQRDQAYSPPYIPVPSKFEEHTFLSLSASRDHLEQVMSHQPSPTTSAEFEPSHHPRIRDTSDFHQLCPRGLTEACKADPYLALFDFELLVEEKLDDWVEFNKLDQAAFRTLGSCLEQYVAATKIYYTSSAEDQSLMLLTIMELWVALDIVVVLQCPLLKQYSPEIPVSILDPLLLRKTVSFGRAARVQVYLRQRFSDVLPESPSIFSHDPSLSSFCVKYFRQSSKLAAIKMSIETAAGNQRKEKCAELQRSNATHSERVREISRLECSYRGPNGQHQHWKCHKCKLQKTADRMRIDVHEWPLPSTPLETEAVVFELNCPLDFSTWRRWTYYILRDIGMSSVGAPSNFKANDRLDRYTPLAAWLGNKTDRIVLASEAKSFLKAHYHEVRIPAAENQVCVNNGLKFKLYDSAREELVHSSFSVDLNHYCTIRLHEDGENLYRGLQYAINSTNHSHNSTIVNQGDCPTNLSMHEHLAFSNLRCGSGLQWLNIARELRTNTLTFSREEVHALFMQAAWQIGPLAEDDLTRQWHLELMIPDFGHVLIQEGNHILSHVETNWMECTTIKTIVYITSRLLSSTQDDVVRDSAYELLRAARRVTYRWMREIVQRIQSAADDDHAHELQRQASEMGAICKATFDVEARDLGFLLCLEDDVAVLIESSVIVHDNTPPRLDDAHPKLRELLRRDRRLSYAVGKYLESQIESDFFQRGMHIAVGRVWRGYRSGHGWQQLAGQNSRWLSSMTAPSGSQSAQRVHYNFINGMLLVEGRQLGRLTREIMEHPMYTRVFGQKILDVIPADIPGMDYAVRSSVNGYKVFFALRGTDLIIRAISPTEHQLELIPPHVLREDFPELLITEYVHWMDIQSGEVEFRPLDRLWTASRENLCLMFSPWGQSRLVFGQSGRSLIDVRSTTFKGIAARLSALEHPQYLTITLGPELPFGSISIELPRLRLSFVLCDGEIESTNMQGMVVDSNQCSGTMIGLRDQLVLCHKDSIAATVPRSRCVLIPYGKVVSSLSADENHVVVHVDTLALKSPDNLVPWYKYDIDNDLGLLVSNVSLTSRLYRIYLHALCSHPLPDPLTQQRGTDHALQELNASASFSFQQATSSDLDLLRLIADITPPRHYYPQHLRSMQSTGWSTKLPAISQHGGFVAITCRIMQHAQSLCVFSKSKVGLNFGYDSPSFLVGRATKRNAVYYEGRLEETVDVQYSSRDSPHISPYESNGLDALKASQSVFAWSNGSTHRVAPSDIFDIFQSWPQMDGPVHRISLAYSHEWLGLELPTYWLSVYELCRQGSRTNRFVVMFSFAALAYSSPQSQKFVNLFLAFTTMNTVSLVPAPPHHLYNLADGCDPSRDAVRQCIRSGLRELADSPSGRLEQEEHESNIRFRLRYQDHYKKATEPRVNRALDFLSIQGRCLRPQSPFNEIDDSEWFNAEEIMDQIRVLFTSCFQNHDLRIFASQITAALQANYIPLTEQTWEVSGFHFIPSFDCSVRVESKFSLENLLHSRLPPALGVSRHDSDVEEPVKFQEQGKPLQTSNVERLISKFQRTCSSTFAGSYKERLENSRKELHGQQTITLPEHVSPISICLEYRDQCQSTLAKAFSQILSALEPLSTAVAEEILMLSGLWPSIHPRALLCCLATLAGIRLSDQWKESLIDFAGLFISYQYSQRLVSYSQRSEVDEFYKELQNATFSWKDARQNPDWLLIQIQGNFMVRAVQSKIAHRMISPSSAKNTVLQLNMGEGKSHVIVPLVVVALADSQKLVRVIVSKPLAGQMFHLLTQRISGLTNRRLFYLPFSRDIRITDDHVHSIRQILEECVRAQGVLVAQPEHILSFRLMVIDHLISQPLDRISQGLQGTEGWLSSVARDVLDESDDLLHVRYQLVYTMGEQQAFDGGSDRWVIAQEVLDRVRRHVKDLDLLQRFSEEIEVMHINPSTAGFPHIRLLGRSVANELVFRIAEDAVNGLFNHLTLVGLRRGSDNHKQVFLFLTERNVPQDAYQNMKSTYGHSGQWKGLLLLRGLLAHGILTYVLSRQRWRVDYGLDPQRSLLAVPYRAKDTPTMRSEFGHPDVAICLTCLSYYYLGLDFRQMQECFDILCKLDNPSEEYKTWVRRGGSKIPNSLREFRGVNMKDQETFKKPVAPTFQHNQSTIDFFLARVVFPREAKEFVWKLGTSGWDLAEEKAHVTTGFSGTNDSSDLLPTSITSADDDWQLATNAQVLEYLLRPENEHYICTESQNCSTKGQPCSSEEFLDLLVRQEPEIRVLLDVGAQMLDMTNQQLVAHWLKLTQSSQSEISAGVFFNESDQLTVVGLDGVVEQLYASPFYQRLDECIVYLDDAHTRGTDLKLPRHYRAAVTLGPKVTKDRLVQGCMRMRKLGRGQSVILCAPPEIDKRIRATQRIAEAEEVQVIDALSWVMSRTCNDIEDQMPHWIDQGVDFHNRKTVNFTSSSREDVIQDLRKVWLQSSARSLENMYGQVVDAPSWSAVSKIPEMHDRLQNLGITHIRDARMEEEQEREVSHELEEQRQIERPAKVEPAIHRLDDFVRLFVQDGRMPTTPNKFFLMTPLQTSAEVLTPENPWSSKLLCTRDFMTTTKRGRETFEITEYLRPVHWVLSHTRSDVLVVISPFEANSLLPDIRASKYVRLHMYAPRATRAMKPLDDLEFYCIPPLSEKRHAWTPLSLDVRCQLNIWSGQLYLDEYNTYLRLCLLLGVSSSEREGYTAVESDRFVPPSGRVGKMGRACLFEKSPISLLKKLFGLRRKGMSFDMTHMGKLLNARLLQPEDFDEDQPAI